jgi:hypothetical protein
MFAFNIGNAPQNRLNEGLCNNLEQFICPLKQILANAWLVFVFSSSCTNELEFCMKGDMKLTFVVIVAGKRKKPAGQFHYVQECKAPP